jgi:adenylosuccinate lyase
MIERYTRPEMAAIWSEEHKLDTWLRIEILVCEGWAREGVIPAEAMATIRNASYNLARAQEIERETRHDVISFLRSVQERLGQEGRFIHLGLTSSDVVDTALATRLVEAGELLRAALDGLTEAVIAAARKYRNTLMVGRTHGIHAEPTTFGFKLAVWVDELRRARTRLDTAIEDIAVGKISGAVGTHATVPPSVEEYVCAQLGLRADAVSSQIVQRDRHGHFSATLALIGSSLEKMAQEIRHLQRTEVSEAFEPFGAGQQGSSAMPHKRNPEQCERICGLARILRGFSVAAMENVALWHERDISHSSAERITLPDGGALLHYMFWLFTDVMAHLDVDEERMRANLEMTRGLIYSSRILLALVERGMDRQTAYKLVQSAAQKVWRNEDGGAGLLAMLQDEPAVMDIISPEELDALADPRAYLMYIDTAYRRLGLD